MKPILRSLTISGVIVVVYPIVVLAVVWPLGVLWGGPYANTVANALLMPLDLPGFIMRSLFSSEHFTYGRMPIEQSILMLGWFIAFNVVLYYIPIRLFIRWRDQARKLPKRHRHRCQNFR
ncbi:MAG: hypothetical protein ABL984_14740 [Pyrinomonadaceae bacterium]